MAFPPAIIASTLLKSVLDRVTSALNSKYRPGRDLRKVMGKLQTTLSMIQMFIEDAEEKQIKNEPVHDWIRALKHVIIDADNVLDEYATRVPRELCSGPNNGSNRFCRKVLNFLACSNILPDITSRDHIAYRHINERLDNIAKNISILGLQVSSVTHRGIEITSRCQTSPLSDDGPVLGRDEEKNGIIRLLLSSPNEPEPSGNAKNFSVLPIVGVASVGKTALARLVFNDEELKGHFHLRLWVCMSGFDVTRVMKEMIGESSSNPSEFTILDAMTNLDIIQHRLMKVVEGKRFLLVLDDAWSKDYYCISEWHTLFEPLQSGGRGSMVIVTTRSRGVVDVIPRRMDPIHLKSLSNDVLWNVFQKVAFGAKQTEHKQLEVIGKQIFESMRGFPMPTKTSAAKTVGRLLNSKLDVEHWREVLQRMETTSHPYRL